MGSMLLIVGLAKGGVLQDQIVVGASGSIMGIVGGTVAVFLRGWAMERARIAARRLVALVFVIAFQVVFDLATPQVSFTAHLGGALIGFAAVSLMRHRVSLAPRRGGDAAAQGDAP
jgi:rhomboid protease GluP